MTISNSSLCAVWFSWNERTSFPLKFDNTVTVGAASVSAELYTSVIDDPVNVVSRSQDVTWFVAGLYMKVPNAAPLPSANGMDGIVVARANPERSTTHAASFIPVLLSCKGPGAGRVQPGARPRSHSFDPALDEISGDDEIELTAALPDDASTPCKALRASWIRVHDSKASASFSDAMRTFAAIS
jgi:hypothetical protein